MVERTPVTSSNISSIGYNPDEKTLAIEYKDGSVYHYSDVEKDTHEKLINARSVGGFLHANIRGIYKHSKQ